MTTDSETYQRTAAVPAASLRVQNEAVNSRIELANELRRRGEAERGLSDGDGGVASYEEAIAILREENEPLLLAHAIRHLGDIHHDRGRNELAAHHYDEALALYREHPEAKPLDLANAIRSQAVLKEETGQIEDAIALWSEAGKLYEMVNVDAGVNESARRVARLTSGS